jgi:hypothetical protein
MAKALTGSEARTVREFIDYPANLADIPQIDGRDISTLS